MYEFEKDYPRLEPLIKALLRAYEGIFDHPSFISELLIAQLLKNDKEVVKQQLTELDAAGIIEYIPCKRFTSIILSFRNRIKSEELTINMISFNHRKEKFPATGERI